MHAALSVQESLGLEKVHMVLSARPGHRGAPTCSVADRWEMLQLACRPHRGLIPDDREIQRPGKSFTYLTVRELAQEGFIPCWIVGQDSFATLAEWYRWEDILEFCNLIVIDRPGALVELPDAVCEFEVAYRVEKIDLSKTGQLHRLGNSMLEISATYIRQCLRNNDDVTDLLNDAVKTYIIDNNLYMEASV